MKFRVISAMVVAAILAVSLGAQTNKPVEGSKPAATSESKELAQFRDFISHHPKAYAELKKDPSLVSSPDFIKSHPRVGQYIQKHPNLKDEVKANPNFLEGSTPKRHEPGPNKHGHRGSPEKGQSGTGSK